MLCPMCQENYTVTGRNLCIDCAERRDKAHKQLMYDMQIATNNSVCNISVLPSTRRTIASLVIGILFILLLIIIWRSSHG